MTLSEYDHLKQRIVLGVGSSERHNQLLSALKDFFRRDINSARRFEQINSIGELLTILELRDVLSEDKVEPLKEIARRLSNSKTLLKNIAEYEVSHVPREYANYYVSENTQTTINREQAESIINCHPYGGTMSKVKKQRLYETIVEEIGTFWTDLARNLKIRESLIDEIENENTYLRMKAIKTLELYEKKADPNRWFFNLCEALEKARRKDLSRSLQEIVTMNI